MRPAHTPWLVATLAVAACGTSTSEPARTEPVRVEAPRRDPGGEPAEGTSPAPRRVEASPPEGDPAPSATAEARRGHRPTVQPPPVEPPTF